MQYGTYLKFTESLQTNEKDEPFIACRGHRDKPPRSSFKKDWWPLLLEVQSEIGTSRTAWAAESKSCPSRDTHIHQLPEALGALWRHGTNPRGYFSSRGPYAVGCGCIVSFSSAPAMPSIGLLQESIPRARLTKLPPRQPPRAPGLGETGTRIPTIIPTVTSRVKSVIQTLSVRRTAAVEINAARCVLKIQFSLEITM